MFKLAVLTNFSYPHQGGSEFVIHNISKRLINKNFLVDVYSYNHKTNSITLDGVNITRYFDDQLFIIGTLNAYNHIWIYSDSFWGMKRLLDNIHNIRPKITLCTVGAYYLQSSPEQLQKIITHKDRFNFVTHSRTSGEYGFLEENGLNPIVIYNGYDENEFDNKNLENIRDKYEIKEKYCLLNVSNYFFGKGQSYLVEIGNKLSRLRDDFCIVSISSIIDYPYYTTFLNRAKNLSRKFPMYFLRNIPRQEVISAFYNSDLFIFTSLKEVAPLVLIESMAAGLPWLSFNTGNVSELEGGIKIVCDRKDSKGYLVPSAGDMEAYVKEINHLLDNSKIYSNYSDLGQSFVKHLTWNKICEKYYETFTNQCGSG